LSTPYSSPHSLKLCGNGKGDVRGKIDGGIELDVGICLDSGCVDIFRVIILLYI
jgi:hypothetical protein